MDDRRRFASSGRRRGCRPAREIGRPRCQRPARQRHLGHSSRRHPPFDSYFIDYFDDVPDAAARGHMGDIAIERQCSPAQRASLPLGGIPPGVPLAGNPPPGSNRPPNIPGPPQNTPPGACQPGQVRRAGTQECGGCSRPNVQIGGVCCSVTQLAANAACSNSSCPAGQTPIGPSNFCCNSGQVYAGAGGAPACCSGPLVNGACPTPPPPPISTCGKGYVPIGNSCCLASQVTSTGICCPAGQAPSGPGKSQCEKIVIVPIVPPMCCASGMIPTVSGQCCPPAHVTTGGVCCPGPVDPANRASCEKLIPLASCAKGYTKMPDGSCCNDRYVGEGGKSCRIGLPSRPVAPLIPLAPGAPSACPAGKVRDRDGDCVRPPPPGCRPGKIRLPNGACVTPGPPPCPFGMIRTPRGFCIPVGPRRLGPGGYGPPFLPPRFGGPRRFGPPLGPRPGLFR